MFFFFIGIKDVIIWGNISGNSYVDLRKAKIYNYESAIWGPPHFSRPVLSLIFDRYCIFFKLSILTMLNKCLIAIIIF